MDRLNQPEAQERYFELIVDRYAKASPQPTDEIQDLARSFGAVSIADTATSNYGLRSSASFSDDTASLESRIVIQDRRESSRLHLAMRKLREGIVAANRADDFAIRVYCFIVRTSVLAGSYEAYYPALSHLLKSIHLKNPLSKRLYVEMLVLYVLDMSCRQEEYNDAFSAVHNLHNHYPWLGGFLMALVQGNWIAFNNHVSKMDDFQRCVVIPAQIRVRQHVVDCMNKCYFAADLDFLERSTCVDWAQLKRDLRVTWELEGRERVIIKRARAR